MPIHDWTRVPSGLFHDFHQGWSIRIKDALNRGLLPKEVSALVEQLAGAVEADVLTIESRRRLGREQAEGNGGVATLTQPHTRIVQRTTREIHSGRANRIVVRHHLGRIIAVIEIIAPGNKDSRAALRDFVDKTIDFLRKGNSRAGGRSLPTRGAGSFRHAQADLGRDYRGRLHVSRGQGPDPGIVRDGRRPGGLRRTGGGRRSMPDMPLCLANDFYVPVPLEPTYQATWQASPEEMRSTVETGIMPEPDAE